jgi:hypothetical protein
VLPEFVADGGRPAFFTQHPLAQLLKDAGRILTSPRITAVFFGADPLQPKTEALLKSVGCTTAWRDEMNEYGVGDALYDHTVVLPSFPPEASGSNANFDKWVGTMLAAQAFGPVSDQQALVFFLPPEAHLDDGDCVNRLGAHDSVPLPSGGQVAIALVLSCSPSDADAGLQGRAFTTAHELMELSTDPIYASPTWTSLGPGVRAPSVLTIAEGAGGDEGADLCNTTPLELPTYPFPMARFYSNRRARAGVDPCDPAGGAVVGPLAALHAGDGVDFTTGRATVVLDIYSPGTGALAMPMTVESMLLAPPTGELNSSPRYSLLVSDVPLSVRNGDSITVDLRWTVPAGVGGSSIPYEVLVSLCPPGSQCSESRIPISALPSFAPLFVPDGGNCGALGCPDAAAPDAGIGDGG